MLFTRSPRRNIISMEMNDIRKFIAENKKKEPFTEEEMNVMLDRMENDNKVMRNGDTVYFV
jgi:hypothetical protein